MSFTSQFDQHRRASNSWSGGQQKDSINDEDDMSVLDGKILDPEPSQFATSSDMGSTPVDQFNAMHSSHGNMWFNSSLQRVYTTTNHRPQDSLSPADNAMTDRTNGDHQQAYYMAANGPWIGMGGPDTGTPTPTYTPAHLDLEEVVLAPSRSAGNVLGQHHANPTPAFALSASMPLSPQSSQGWISATSSEVAESQSRALRSPTLQPTSPISVQRRDGVRKKNARFEIPKDRNLNTIDQLIKVYTEQGDDLQLKELKQQKRLLRNRQAALDSRQRKKQHTEDLEKEKMRTDQYIKDLEDECESYKLTVSEFMQNQAALQDQQRQMHECFLSLQMERDELIRTSTLEAENLRRQNNILRAHAQRLEHEHASLQSNAQANEFPNFENSSLPTDWNDFNMSATIKVDQDATAPSDPSAFLRVSPESETLRTEGSSTGGKNDYPFSWNTFYMCLLFGAFIASNTATSSSSTSTKHPAVNIPALSEEYRAESVNVLKAVLASGPDSGDTFARPQRQSYSHSAPLNAAETANIAPSATYHAHTGGLDDLHNSLTSLTSAQEEMQAFSLTSDQYASITGLDSQDYQSPNHHSFSSAHATAPRQAKTQTPLQRAFATLKQSQDHIDQQVMPGAWGRSAVVNAATMNPGFTWDQVAEKVPQKVLQDFKRMVKNVDGDTTIAEMVVDEVD